MPRHQSNVSRGRCWATKLQCLFWLVCCLTIGVRNTSGVGLPCEQTSVLGILAQNTSGVEPRLAGLFWCLVLQSSFLILSINYLGEIGCVHYPNQIRSPCPVLGFKPLRQLGIVSYVGKKRFPPCQPISLACIPLWAKY